MTCVCLCCACAVCVLVVQVLQADGSLLAVAMNAVCAALADACIPMKSMFGEHQRGVAAAATSQQPHRSMPAVMAWTVQRAVHPSPCRWLATHAKQAELCRPALHPLASWPVCACVCVCMFVCVRAQAVQHHCAKLYRVSTQACTHQASSCLLATAVTHCLPYAWCFGGQ